MNRDIVKGKVLDAQTSPQIDSLYQVALCVLGDEFKAQDLILETFVKAFQSWSERQCSSNRRICLFRIMASILIDKNSPSPNQLKALNGIVEIDEYSGYPLWLNRRPSDNRGRDFLPAISEIDVKTAFRKLPDDYRLIIALSLLGHFSYREIVDITSIDLENVRSRLYQGYKSMRLCLLGNEIRVVD
jgi:RNA polymerase sigma-70 factor (ECF subfamily)